MTEAPTHCFADLVTIEKCQVPVPEGAEVEYLRGGYPIKVNDLPQISTEMVMEIVDTDMDSHIELFNKISSYGWELFQQYLLEELAKRGGVLFENILWQNNEPQINNPQYVVSPNLQYVGQQLIVRDAKFVEYRLNGVWVASSSYGTSVTISIIDLGLGKVLDTITDTLSIDSEISYIEIDKVYKPTQNDLNLGVVIDGTGVAFLQFWCNGQMSDCGCSKRRGKDALLSIEIDELTAKQNEVVTIGDGNSGICLDGEITCSLEDFICKNKYHFAFAFRLLLGSLYFQKARVPDGALNFWKMMPPEVLKEFEDELRGQFLKVLKTTVMRLPLSGICLSCKGELKGGYSISSNV